MSFTMARKPADFLDYVGNFIRIVDGKAECIPEDERHGQRTMDFLAAKKPSFLIDVDVVIEGGCADMFLMEPTRQFLMGKCIKEAGKENEPRRSWLHEVIKEYAAKSVLIIPSCCGPYAEEHQEMVRAAFPNVQFYFPYIGNLHDNTYDHLDQLSDWLIEANIMAGKE